MDAARREPLRVAVELLEALLHEPDLVGLVVDREVRPVPEPRRLAAEDPAAGGVERHHPGGARGRADEVLDALPHLGRALFVNVMARISGGFAPTAASRCAIRRVRTRVFPEPAPAMTRSGPSVVRTASRWAGFRSSRYVSGCVAATGRG